MNCAHVKGIAELFGMIGEGKMSASYIVLLVMPLICAAVVQFFVLGRAKKRFVGFIPLIMVVLTSIASELIYAGVIPIGTSSRIIGMIYAGAALLCYAGLAIGASAWFAACGSRRKKL